MQVSNDDHFDPREQLRVLSEEQALEYARAFFDQNCAESDATFLSDVITAGVASPAVTYLHALRGSPTAQLVYGSARLTGAHVEQCVSEGLFWLLRSFNNGNAKAALMLAGIFVEGKYVKRCTTRAMEFAAFASDRGVPAGQFVLANLLMDGDGAMENQARAIELLQAAAGGGYARARQMLEDNGIPFEPV